MSPLPSFTVTGSLNDVYGDVVGGGLSDVALAATVRFTSNIDFDTFVVWEGRGERIHPVEAEVSSAGLLRNGSPVQLLANDSGLNVNGIQWLVEIITTEPLIQNRIMRSFIINAPANGGTVDLATAVPVPGMPIGPSIGGSDAASTDAGPPLAADVTQGLYARTIPSPSGEATIRPICTDPNNTGYIWAVGGTSTQIGYTTDHGATFHTTVANPAGMTIQQAKITTNYMWLLTSAGTSRSGQLWRSPKPNGTGSNLSFTKIFDLIGLVNGPGGAAGDSFAFNATFRQACFDILPDESKCYLVTYGGGNDSLHFGGHSDAVMTAGSDYLFSASGGDVISGSVQGLSITVAGAGAGGATLSTTIAEVYSPTLLRLAAPAQTSVSAATWDIPNQTWGAGSVLGGARLFRSDNPNTATVSNVVFSQAYNQWNWGRHAHAVHVIGGVPWVSIGDYAWPAGTRYNWPPLTHAGLYAATDNTGTAFVSKIPMTITNPYVFIDFAPITVGGQNIIVGESDGPFGIGPIFCPTQSNAAGHFNAASPILTAMPQVATMRALTVTPEGNLLWLGTGESGAVGPVDCVMLSKPPFTVAVVLEQMALDTIAFPQLGFLDGNYVWIGTHRIAREKFIGQ